MKKIEFWYSIGSTYTYLSTQRLGQIESQNEVKFEWMPFSVRSRMIEMENVPFMAEKKRDKIDYMWRDVQRRANFYGFDAKIPAPYPLKEFDLANKVAIMGKDQGWIKEYTVLTYKKWFLEHLEPGSEPNLSSTLEEIGLDAKNIIKQAQADDIEQKYLKIQKWLKTKVFLEAPHLSLKMRFSGVMIGVKMLLNGSQNNGYFQFF